MRKVFGTDGIRGKANEFPITPEIALQLGKAIATHFNAEKKDSVKAVIGKDTRLSGYMLEKALQSGLLSMGMNVLEVGSLPTPAIAHLIKSFNANCGIMITASHNSYKDNGIKIFGPDGFKLPDEVELKIEDLMFNHKLGTEHIGTKHLGKAFKVEDAKGRYIEFAKGSIKDTKLNGLKLVLDCANGAAYSLAPWIFQELGAEVIEFATKPDGFNINKECGATSPGNISEIVKQNNADLGICLDGDGDRVIFLDNNGRVVNGDRIIALCALDLADRNELNNNTVVTTVMSNLGFYKAMEKNNINVKTSKVGDRYVIEKMREGNLNLGGENSGHIIFMDYVTTGDSIITALHVLRIMKEKNKSIEELADCMEEYPQVLLNVEVKEKPSIENIPGMNDLLSTCKQELGDNGRTLIRYSGTENLLRILVEAKPYSLAERWANKIAKHVKSELG